MKFEFFKFEIEVATIDENNTTVFFMLLL